MGRKKKRDKQIIFCYYCDRIYENERVLIQHQRAKHFKCPQCHKRISTAQGMMVHMFQVHKETIENVPAAREGRDSFDVEIFGMDGVPQEVIEEKRIKMFGEPAKKKKKVASATQPIVQPQAHEIKIPGTRNVFRLGPASTPGVNPLMMVRMSGMPMFPGMPYPGIPQVLPPPLPVPVSAMQLPAPISSISNQAPALPGSLAVTQGSAPMLVGAPTGVCIAPPNIPPPSISPPNIAPPPADSLVDFPKLPPPQFKDIPSPETDKAAEDSLREKTEESIVQAPQITNSLNNHDIQNVKDSSGKQSRSVAEESTSSQVKEKNVSCHKMQSSTDAPLKNLTSGQLPGPTIQSHITAAKKDTSTSAIQTTEERKTLASYAPTSRGFPPPSSNVAAPTVSKNKTPSISPPKAEPARGPRTSKTLVTKIPQRIPLSFPKGPTHQVSSMPSQQIRHVHPITGTRKGKSPIIPMMPFTSGQPVGKYIPKVGVSKSSHSPSISPPQLSQAPLIASAADKSSPHKKRTTIRIYNDRNISQEEKRAMHSKYNAHLNKRIESLSESIEERLRTL